MFFQMLTKVILDLGRFPDLNSVADGFSKEAIGQDEGLLYLKWLMVFPRKLLGRLKVFYILSKELKNNVVCSKDSFSVY